jgi:aminopeptidase N
MVGKKAFVKMMQEYIRRWQGKHPLPYDFFFTANNLLKEDLSWFWNTWFSGFGYPDLKLEKAQMKDGKLLLKVVRKGLLPVPIKLTIVYSDSSSDVLERSMRVWSKGQNAIELVTEPKKSVLEVKLGDAHIPDADDRDNLIRF